jgi:RNA polymerase sigma factor (sigma-70 family)
VLNAKEADLPSAGPALEQLCRTYWYPLYAFIRRRGHSATEAEDLTQAFFVLLLEKDALKRVGPEKGRFRSFLLAALTNFLNNEYHKSQASKRGAAFLESWDALEAEERYRREPAHDLTPARLFERRWAFTIIEEVLRTLREEYRSDGRLAVFEELHPFLVGEVGPGSIQASASRLGMNAGAAKVALHRLRRRFGVAVRNQIAGTVATPDEVEDEIRHLFSIISAQAL